MKKLSLQVKITLLCTAILTAACVLLTVSSVLFSSRGLVGRGQAGHDGDYGLRCFV